MYKIHEDSNVDADSRRFKIHVQSGNFFPFLYIARDVL